jgi:hypothetical protein
MSMIEDYSRHIGAAIIGGIATGFAWLVRTVFTNQRLLQLLEQKQDMQHTEIKEALQKLEQSTNDAIGNQMLVAKILKSITDQEKVK